MKRVAIITARGGSKRIPRKNVKSFCGKPILAYSIQAAHQAGIFQEVMVSTDDHEIAEVAVQHGAKVPFFRSAANSDDFSTTADVLREVLLEYQNLGEHFEQFCCIYPTAPFVTPARIRQAMELLQSSGADCVLPVVRFSYPIQRSLKICENGRAEMIWPENYLARSQDLMPAYHDSGQFYCMQTQSLLDQMRLFADHTIPIVLSEMEVQDIDTAEDWEVAEVKYRLLGNASL